jgi:hypothetical protein
MATTIAVNESESIGYKIIKTKKPPVQEASIIYRLASLVHLFYFKG